MRKYILVGLFLLALQVSAFGQYALLKVADKEFEAFNFASAVKYYHEAFDKRQTVHAMTGIADSYFQMRDFQNSELWYGRLANLDQADPDDILRYGHSLRNNAKFKEAKAQYERLAQRNDRTASLDELELLARSCDSAALWIQNPHVGHQIENLRPVNSRFSEFGAVNYQNRLVFSSDRNANVQTDATTYGWTGNAYLSLYQSNNGQVSKYPLEWYNEEHHVGPVTVSATSNEVYFSVTRELTSRERRQASKMATVNIEIFSNELTAADWGHQAKPFRYNNITEWSVGDPFLSSRGDTLYFVSDMPGGFGGTDIYYVIRTADGQWGEAINMGAAVNTHRDERFPSKDAYGHLYFSSEGHIGMGGLDVFVLENGARTVKNMGYPVNSPGDDFAVRFDQSYSGYMASNRTGGQGLDDIYHFNINREVKVDLQGRVLNAKSGLPIAGAQVRLVETSNQNEAVLSSSNRDGSFKFNLDTDASYSLEATQTGFRPYSAMTFNTRGVDSSQTMTRDILLEPVVEEEVVVLRNIYFDFDKSDIRPDAALELAKILSFLDSDPSVRIELSAHTDSRGSQAYNMDLSQRRADAAVAFLTADGVDPSRLVSRGYGFSRLANHCAPGVECTDEEHQFNRRVEFFVIKN